LDQHREREMTTLLTGESALAALMSLMATTVNATASQRAGSPFVICIVSWVTAPTGAVTPPVIEVTRYDGMAWPCPLAAGQATVTVPSDWRSR
jgi:hypothetical protein